jgi:ribosomal-protein-alanine N-acetyltransferase
VEEAGVIIAFSVTVLTSSTTARVLMVGVLPAFRQRSIGRGLMGQTYSRCLAQGIDTITLEVRKSNAAAVAFYEREGFSICGEIKNFYSNGEDAHKMMKALTS